MKRSLQEYVELVVFGLIALLVGTGLLWVLGWVLSLGGIVLKGLAGLLWMLLRFIVPVAIAGGLVYFLVKAAQDRQKPAAAGAGSASTGSHGTGVGTSAPEGGVSHVAPVISGPVSPGVSPASADAAAVAAEATVDYAADALTEESFEMVDDASDAVADTTAADDEAEEDESTA